MTEEDKKNIQDAIDSLAMATEILARKLKNVVGGNCYYEVCEKLNETVNKVCRNG